MNLKRVLVVERLGKYLLQPPADQTKSGCIRRKYARITLYIALHKDFSLSYLLIWLFTKHKHSISGAFPMEGCIDHCDQKAAGITAKLT